MSSYRNRRVLAVLIIAAFASFVAIRAQDVQVPGSAFRETTAWSFANVEATLTGAASRDNPLYTRGALADSVTSPEFRAPKGARADLYLQGRYGIALEGTGDWQPVAVRFRAPRLDGGYNKIANAFMPEV